jgi:hypothetical protein
VDSKVVSPSKTDATDLDKTYYYKNPVVGEQKKLVTVAVHFKNAFRGADQNLASIDGIWQISDAPSEVKADTQYGKMTIRGVDANAGTITMDNKDNAITLSKNKDTELMPGINIKTADNDTLRFYIYKPVTIEGTTPTATENVASATKADSVAKENLTAATAAVAVAEANTTKAEAVVAEKKTEPAPAANNTTAVPATKPAPGFESILAITGLLAVAFLVLGRRE